MDNFYGGGASTCFCFGQTASGKTFTLFGAEGGQFQQSEALAGSSSSSSSSSGGSGGGVADGLTGPKIDGLDPELDGLYVLAAQEAFRRLGGAEARAQGLRLTLSMFEIYGQKVTCSSTPNLALGARPARRQP